MGKKVAVILLGVDGDSISLSGLPIKSVPVAKGLYARLFNGDALFFGQPDIVARFFVHSAEKNLVFGEAQKYGIGWLNIGRWLAQTPNRGRRCTTGGKFL